MLRVAANQFYTDTKTLQPRLDGFKAVIHFTDEANDLSCPADLIVVDRSKFIKTAYIPVKDDPHTHLKKLFELKPRFFTATEEQAK